MNKYVKEPSIYHSYKVICNITETAESIPEWSMGMDSPLANFGYNVLQTINKYEVLNKKNLEFCVNLKNPSKWKTDNLTNVLRSLRKSGYINSIGLKPIEEAVTYSITLYTLTAKANNLLQENGITPHHKAITSFTEEAVDRLLSKASINQWHIGLIRNYKASLKESKYCGYTIKGNVSVPSVIRIKNIKRTKKELLAIYSFPAPKNKSEIKDFLLKIITLQSVIVERKNEIGFIIAVCENMPHACWIASYVNKFRQTRPFYVVYAHDMATVRDNPLENMFLCEAEEIGIKQTSLNLLK